MCHVPCAIHACCMCVVLFVLWLCLAAQPQPQQPRSRHTLTLTLGRSLRRLLVCGLVSTYFVAVSSSQGMPL